MVHIGDFDFPEDRLYFSDHIWVKLENESAKMAIMGIDEMGFAIAGTISMIRVKKSGKPLAKGRAFGTMESGKGVIPLKSPLSGIITDVNPLLDEKKFTVITEKPFDNWLVKIQYENPDDLKVLMKSPPDIVKWAKEELAKIKK